MSRVNIVQGETLSSPRPLKRKKYCGLAFQLVLGAILIAFVIVPLITIFCKIDSNAVENVFHGGYFAKALGNSVLTTLISTVISVMLAYCLAWAVSRTNIKFKGVFSVLLILPMLIPSISHGMGLVIMFGNNGIVTRLFGATSHLYGYAGIIVGSVMYSFPVAFLMFVDILKYEDSSVYDAADILGIPKVRQFFSISLPYMRRALISIFFAVFTLIITDYGIPLSVGGNVKTLSVLLYENAVGQLDYSSGALIGIFLLVPAIVAFVLDLFNGDKNKSLHNAKKFSMKKNTMRDTIAYIICILVSLFILFVVVSFCVQAFSTAYPYDMTFTFKNFENVFNKNGLTYLYNSIIISLFTAFVGMVVAFLTAYLTSRIGGFGSKVLHIISITSMTIPGLVLGLAYVILFKSTFFYGTIVILILVNTVHFFSSPYLMLYNALNKVNENLESVGQVLGIPRYRIIADCVIPQCGSTLIEAFSYFFVNSMMTISAVSFLATRNNKPLSLMINQFEAYNMLECAAVVALMILLVNVIMKTIFYLIRIRGRKNVNKKAV